MISHKECAHESTPAARSKCRRQKRQVGFGPPLYSLGPPPASVKEVDFSSEGHGRSTTPRGRDKQCDVCGVERIKWRGVDILSGLTLYVGQRCFYMVKRDPNKPTLVDKKA